MQTHTLSRGTSHALEHTDRSKVLLCSWKWDPAPEKTEAKLPLHLDRQDPPPLGPPGSVELKRLWRSSRRGSVVNESD